MIGIIFCFVFGFLAAFASPWAAIGCVLGLLMVAHGGRKESGGTGE